MEAQRHKRPKRETWPTMENRRCSSTTTTEMFDCTTAQDASVLAIFPITPSLIWKDTAFFIYTITLFGRISYFDSIIQIIIYQVPKRSLLFIRLCNKSIVLPLQGSNLLVSTRLTGPRLSNAESLGFFTISPSSYLGFLLMTHKPSLLLRVMNPLGPCNYLGSRHGCKLQPTG
jgi:hypothetical protein